MNQRTKMINDQNGNLLFEFQGSFENFNAFDGKYDEKTMRMYFKDFFLQGFPIQKNITLYEKVIVDGKNEIKRIKVFRTVILFNKPPRYLIIKKT